MQLLEHWDPLNLPRGSVRALVTLALLAVLCTLLLQERDVPFVLGYVALLATGHYFGARGAHGSREARSPLFLPRGSIRILIVLGLAVTGYLRWTDGQDVLDFGDVDSALFLILAAVVVGFVLRKLLDAISGGKVTPSRRWVENIKAILAILATGVLAVAVLARTGKPEQELIALLTAPLIVLYFGSRN